MAEIKGFSFKKINQPQLFTFPKKMWMIYNQKVKEWCEGRGMEAPDPLVGND